MKKIALLLLLLVSFSSVKAQNKTQEKKINYFVEAAATTFSLDASKTKELLDARNVYVSKFMAINKAGNAGTLSVADKKAKLNEVNNDFNAAFYSITGKTAAESKPFFDRMRNELKGV